MIANSLVDKIHPTKPAYKKYHWFKGKELHKVVQPMLIEKNEEVGLISKVPYSYKDGYFYTVINKRNEVFHIEPYEINFKGDVVNKTTFENKIPKFIDFIEVEEFSLDDL